MGMQRHAGPFPATRQDPAVRERIEWAAVQVFANSEFHHVTLQQIARAASCSLQTIYRYYGDDGQGSKEALLSACLHHGLGQLAERMLDHLAGIDTLAVMMLAIVSIMFAPSGSTAATLCMRARVSAPPRVWEKPPADGLSAVLSLTAIWKISTRVLASGPGNSTLNIKRSNCASGSG